MSYDFPRERVPASHGKSGWHIGLIYIGVGLTMPAFLTGALLGQALGLQQALLAAVVSGLILTVTGALTGFIGTKVRLSTYLITTYAFGRIGGKLISGLLALSLFGWFGVTIAMLSEALNAFASAEFGWEVSKAIWSGIAGMLMVSTAVWGFHGLSKLSFASVPFILALLIYSNFKSIQMAGFSEVFAFPGDQSLTFGVAVSMLTGGWMVGATVLPDLARYGRKPSDGPLAAFLCFIPGLLVIMTLSMIPVVAIGRPNVIEALTFFGWPLLTTLVVLLAAWSSNDNNLYSASLSIASIVPKVAKWKITVVAGVIGTLLAMLGIMQIFIQFLVMLGIFVPPVAGIYVVDYWLHPMKYAQHNPANIGRVNLLALSCWVTASAVAFATTPVDAAGFGKFDLTTIPALDGLLIAMALYYLLSKVSQRFSVATKSSAALPLRSD